MNSLSLSALLPDVVVAVGAMLLLLWSAARRDGDVGVARSAALGVVGVCGVALIAIVLLVRGVVTPGAAAGLATDNFRWAVDAVILIGTAFSALLAGDDVRSARAPQTEAFALMLLSTSGMMLLAGARDLILVFLGIELMSIPVYVLAGIDRRSARSAEAALKYFLLSSFATAFLLYGVALVYGATGSTELSAIAHSVAAANGGASAGALPPAVLGLGIGFVLVGLAFKVGAVPFHMWTPDVYDGAPTPYTAFMAVTVKAAAFAAFARVVLEGLGGAAERWHFVLWWVAVITMVGGNLVALAQRSIKRMLAYSSIAHAGYLIVPIVTNSAQGSSAVVFYLFAYTFATVGAFAVLQAVGGTSRADLANWDGLFAARPKTAIAMAVFMLALLGFPLAGGMGFFAKWYLLQSALSLTPPAQPQTRLAVILVVASVISAGYYLTVVARMFMRARPADAAELPPMPRWTGGVITACAVLLLLLGVYPTPAVNVAQASALRPALPQRRGEPAMAEHVSSPNTPRTVADAR